MLPRPGPWCLGQRWHTPPVEERRRTDTAAAEVLEGVGGNRRSRRSARHVGHRCRYWQDQQSPGSIQQSHMLLNCRNICNVSEMPDNSILPCAALHSYKENKENINITSCIVTVTDLHQTASHFIKFNQ